MQAIVLSRRDFREFDQIISVYTKENGKLELLARGVKKIISKNAAHLEPFCLVLIEVAPGKEIDHLTKVVPVEMFAEIRQDYQKSLAAWYAVDLMNRLIHPGQPDAKMWELARRWFGYLNRSSRDKAFPRLYADAFMLRLFATLGYRPILNHCVVCGKKYQELVSDELIQKKKSGLYFAAGGLICPICFIDKRKAGEEIIQCGLKEINTMQILLAFSWERMSKIELSEDEKTAVHRLVYEFALYHSERKVADWTAINPLSFYNLI